MTYSSASLWKEGKNLSAACGAENNEIYEQPNKKDLNYGIADMRPSDLSHVVRAANPLHRSLCQYYIQISD